MQAHGAWAEGNFGACELGDKRRTRRLVRVAADIANNPSASLPDQMLSSVEAVAKALGLKLEAVEA